MTRHLTSLKYVSLATASSLSFRSCPEALALNPVFCFCFFAKKTKLEFCFGDKIGGFEFNLQLIWWSINVTKPLRYKLHHNTDIPLGNTSNYGYTTRQYIKVKYITTHYITILHNMIHHGTIQYEITEIRVKVGPCFNFSPSSSISGLQGCTIAGHWLTRPLAQPLAHLALVASRGWSLLPLNEAKLLNTNQRF